MRQFEQMAVGESTSEREKRLLSVSPRWYALVSGLCPMNKRRNHIRGRIWLAMGLALFSRGALAGVLAPGKASDVVTLSNGPGDPCVVTGGALDFRVTKSGTLEPFSIPAKHVLVVTGIDFTTGTTNATNVEVFVEKAPNTTQIFVTSVTGGGGAAAIPNAIVGPGSSLCVQATLKAGGTSTIFAIAHGFLANDK